MSPSASAGEAVTVRAMLPVLGELHRVVEHVQQDLADAADVADDRLRDTVVDLGAELEPLGRCERADQGEHAVDTCAEVEGCALELHAPGFDLGEVEDVVDDREQRLAARADDLGRLALLRVELGAQQQPAHPDHRIHRRADLVAHGGEEDALRLRCQLRLLACALELADEPRLVDRRRGERGEGLRHVGVLRRVEVLLEGVERQHPHQAVADEQRNSHPRLDGSVAVDVLELPDLPISNRHVRNDEGFVPLDELAGGIVRSRHAVAMPEQFVEIRITLAADDHELVAVQLLDAGTSIGHHLAQLRQDEIEYLMDPQRAPERLGGRTQCLGLFAGFALGLEQPGILDRRRSLSSECGRELRELFVVDVGLELVDAQDTDDAVADDHRGTDPSADSSTPVDVARKVRVLGHVGEELLPPRSHDMAVEVGLVGQVEGHPHQAPEIVETPRADDHEPVALDHLDGTAVVRHDSLQLAEDRFDRVLEAERLPEHLRHGEQRLGLLPRALQLGDVVVDGVETDMLAVQLERDEHHLHVDQLAVLSRTTGDAVDATSRECLAGDVPPFSAELVGENEVVDQPSDRLVR